VNLETATNKKQVIIRTAIDLFASQGYNGSTTLQIGETAGVTEPAFFYYFKTKGELFAEIIESIFKK
jgi:AcrR family transcriptional regulator